MVYGNDQHAEHVYVKVFTNSPTLVCMDLTLSQDEVIDPRYSWTGPDGRNLEGQGYVNLTSSGELVLLGFQESMSGAYNIQGSQPRVPGLGPFHFEGMRAGSQRTVCGGAEEDPGGSHLRAAEPRGAALAPLPFPRGSPPGLPERTLHHFSGESLCSGMGRSLQPPPSGLRGHREPQSSAGKRANRRVFQEADLRSEAPISDHSCHPLRGGQLLRDPHRQLPPRIWEEHRHPPELCRLLRGVQPWDVQPGQRWQLQAVCEAARCAVRSQVLPMNVAQNAETRGVKASSASWLLFVLSSWSWNSTCRLSSS
ncbi:zona pellucida-binding protein 2 isoform X3 [Lagopus muta]|uniref:zona pellucida-binding protein 2 isoform X3 n=1 Tax=Lagopus muta TaxID=64668 RepID=UPI0020A1019C|nr:zona pellucida-binding protein 2 isoform X3 [Lagopus muta]